MKTITKKTLEIWTAGKPATKAILGGKGFNLAKLLEEKTMSVPDFIVITPTAFFNSLTETDRANWSALDNSQRMALVETLMLSDATRFELQETLEIKNLADVYLAVRSSGVDEDGSGLSYAGQFSSILNVKAKNIASAVEAVWRSAFTTQILTYRSLNGVTAPLEPPCVIVQRMVPARAAGVAFGANPLTGCLEERTISAVRGLGDKLVSGEVDAATYVWKAGRVTERDSESLCPLTDREVCAISELVDRACDIFGSPQDIEWVIDKQNQLFIVQSRPITTLNEDVKFDIFDNSNIGESYPGTTTPLTFSFARKAYEHVYETFCRLMGVSETAIKKHSFIFPQMLGFVRGRIYYNLLNWYRLLSLFPGFKTNRGFMEQMMGVKAGLPQEFLAEFNRPHSRWERTQDAFSMSVSIPKLMMRWLTLGASIQKFNSRVETSLARMPKDLSQAETVELGKLYRTMEEDLLQNWDAPIVNDFFAMVSFGSLRALCSKWLVNMDGIHNQLLCGETGIVSTEPVARMQELAAIAAGDKALLRTLSAEIALPSDDKTISERNLYFKSQLQQFPNFNSKYTSYLEKFGDRCTGELKLESPTLSDNPRAFLNAIVRLAQQQIERNTLSDNAATETAQTNRANAETHVFNALRDDAFKSFIFKLILWQTRSRIRERENLRFMRTRVFGAVRRLFVEIGRRFEDQNILNNRNDIFWLETEEVLQSIGKPSNTSELKSLVAARIAEHEVYRTTPAPPDRFSIKSGSDLNSLQLGSGAALPLEADGTVSAPAFGSTLYRGIGCCPGTVSGYARVIEDPNEEQLSDGELLVARRTDPGWITVIAQARGIVVEYGSLLSHTAIVARELGIPTIVSVSNVTTSVKSGDWLDINGATGEVRVTPQHADVALAVDEQTEDDETVEELHAPMRTTRQDGFMIEPSETNLVQDKMKSEIQGKAGFSFVRYAQCWEDSDIVIEAMNIQPGDVCVSIASAGDNSLALLTKNPGKVVALDLSPAQLALLELKAMAFKHLCYEDMLVLLGYESGKSRIELFEAISQYLSTSTFQYWNEHRDDIECGVASAGKFEHYFDIFRRFSLPLTHSKRTIDELLRPKSRVERERFFNRKWNTFRWRALFKVFFSEFVMGALGRDPSFFTYAEGGLPGALMQWTRKALVEQDPSRNPYLHWILKGKFGDTLPMFLRRENFDAIKRNIDRLQWHQQSIEEYLAMVPNKSVDSFNLSDVFEYVSEDNYRSIMKLIVEASKPAARVVYWNMMAPRTSRGSNIKAMKDLTQISETLFAENKTFFYSKFIVEEVQPNFEAYDTRASVGGEAALPEIEGRAA